jgi:hypothetical protein
MSRIRGRGLAQNPKIPPERLLRLSAPNRTSIRGECLVSRLAILAETRQRLNILCGNQCYYPGCDRPVYDDSGQLLAQLAHIEAASPGGERYNENSNDEERRAFDNLLYLCYEHHQITNDVHQFTTAKLKMIKANHEARYSSGRGGSILSEQDLKRICQRSCQRYRETIFLPHDPIDRLGTTQAAIKLLRRGRNGQVVSLLADSGMGKSVTAFQILSKWLDLGECGFFVPPDIFELELGLHGSIEHIIKAIDPSSTSHCFNRCLNLTARKRGILIVIDDIAKSNNPKKLLEWVCSASQNAATKDDTSESRASIQFLIPLQPKILRLVRSDFKSALEPSLLEMAPLSTNEGENIVLAAARASKRTTSQLEASEVTHRLGFDPLLLSLWNGGELDWTGVMKRFVGDVHLRLETTDNIGLNNIEFHQSVLSLCEKMIKNKCLYPRWHDVLSWFGDDSRCLNAFNAVLKSGELCKLDADRISFRHDRIRDFLFSESIKKLLDSDSIEEDTLLDPFLTKFVARAIYMIDCKRDLLSKRFLRNPMLAILTLLEFREICRDADDLLNVITSNRHHLSRFPSMKWQIQNALAESDSPYLTRLLNALEDRNHLAEFALGRAGDLMAAARYCGSDFGANSVWRSQLVSHVKLKLGSRLQYEVEKFLSNATQRDILECLIFVGYIGCQGLDSVLLGIWEKHKNNITNPLLTAFIWSGLRCSSDPASTLRLPFERWRSLSSAVDEVGRSERNGVVQYTVDFAVREVGLSEQSIAYLVNLSEDSDLQWQILGILIYVDDPSAVYAIARRAAKIRKELRGTNKISTFLLGLGRHWRPDQVGSRPLSRETRRNLADQWLDQNLDEDIRYYLFEFWGYGAEVEEISTLQTIPNTDPLWENSLRLRAKLGDRTTVPLLTPFLQGPNARYWFQHVREIWCSEIEVLVARSIRKDSDSFPHINNLCSIDQSDARRFIVTYLSTDLERHHEFWGLMLLIGDASLQNTVIEALKRSGSPDKQFKFFGSRYQSQIENLDELTLKRLAPIFQHLDELGLHALWKQANRLAIYAWRVANLDRLLIDKSYGDRLLLTDDSRTAELNRLHVGKGGWTDHFIERLIGQGVSPQDILQLSSNWARDKNDLKAYAIYSSIFNLCGNRGDIEFYKSSIPGAEIYQDMVIDTCFAVQARSF